jgi:uncharacterized protein (TIGR03435 family)
MPRATVSASFVIFAACGLFGQSGTLVFEVASIRPNKSGERLSSMLPPALGRFTAKNVSLNMLVRAAYQVRDFQITGGAGWTESERYDVEAKAEGNPNRDQLQLMLRALLADRFQLRVHPETRELPIYALKVVNRQGPNLHAVENSGCLEGAAPAGPCGLATLTVRGQVTAEKASMSQFAQITASITGRTVVNRTDMPEVFDIKLEWTPDEGQAVGRVGDSEQLPPDPNGPSLFTALQEQLGLKLEPTKAPVQIVVIDHAERPSDN